MNGRLIVRVLVGLLMLPSMAGAQEAGAPWEVDVRADLLEGDVEDGERIRRLTGNVRLRQEDTHLRARQAVQFIERREVLFMGDVFVVERGDTLRTDSLLYDSLGKTGRARGRVRLSDGEVLVRAPSGLYFTREKRAQFTDGVTLVDSTATLTSQGGEYWSGEKRAEFYGAVTLREPGTFLTADSVTYYRESDISLARGRVFIERLGDEDGDEDSLVRSLLFGERAHNDDPAGTSRMQGYPLLMQLRRDSVDAPIDTLLIRARVLESSRSDSAQRLVAFDSVRIWRSGLAALADSVVYSRTTSSSEGPRLETVRFFGDPMVWFQENQVWGDTLWVEGRPQSVDTLFVRGGAFVARRDSVLDRVHQLRGGRLVATFERDSLRTLSIGPQAEAVHFRRDEDETPGGAVHMSADRIDMYFQEGNLERLEAIRGTEGTYYPETVLSGALSLEGFVWLPAIRPRKRSLLGDVGIPVQGSVALDDTAPSGVLEAAGHIEPADSTYQGR